MAATKASAASLAGETAATPALEHATDEGSGSSGALPIVVLARPPQVTIVAALWRQDVTA
jgi:hypothetical protein